MQEAHARSDSLDRIDKAPLLGKWEKHQRNAAYDGADASVPFGRDEVRQLPRVALDDMGAWQGLTQMGGHGPDDLDHQQLFGRNPRGDQRLADHPGAGPKFEHGLVGIDARMGRDAAAQCWRRRHDGAHLQRIGEPALEEQPDIRDVGAWPRRRHLVPVMALDGLCFHCLPHKSQLDVQEAKPPLTT